MILLNFTGCNEIGDSISGVFHAVTNIYIPPRGWATRGWLTRDRHPGRLLRGVAKLNDDGVRATRPAASGAMHRRPAQDLDDATQLIGYTVRREIWKHVA